MKPTPPIVKPPADETPNDRKLIVILGKHPQFHRAAMVAPDFVADVFKTLTRLEKQLDKLMTRRCR